MQLAYPVTWYGVTITEPVGKVETEISKIAPATQQKNPRDIFNLLNIQDNDLWDIYGNDTLFMELLMYPVNQQVKVIYGMGLGNARIGKTSTITKTILTLYG